MGESITHKVLKNKAAGSGGDTEKKISGNRYLNARNKVTNTVTEIERSGNLKEALRRLATQANAKKVLMVPNPQIDNAKLLAEKMKMKVTISNLGGTKRRYANR